MPKPLSAFVPGIPAPQGSKSFKGTFKGKDGRVHGIMAESSKKVEPWRQDVRQAFTRAGEPLARFPGAVTLYFEFVLPRPKRLGQHKSEPHVVKPDLDKLARSTKDALTSAGVLSDDCTVVAFDGCSKRYADYGEATGAFIRVADPFPEFTKPQPKGKRDGQVKEQRADAGKKAGSRGRGARAAAPRSPRGRKRGSEQHRAIVNPFV